MTSANIIYYGSEGSNMQDTMTIDQRLDQIEHGLKDLKDRLDQIERNLEGISEVIDAMCEEDAREVKT